MFSRSCKHERKYRVLDARDATEICSNCALVLDEAVYNASYNDLNNSCDYNPENTSLNKYVYNKINEWVHRLRLDDNISIESICLFNKEYELILGKRGMNIIDKYIALSIFETIIKNNIPLCLEEILTFSSNSYREIWELAKIEKRVIILSNQISTNQFIDRHISHFKLLKHERTRIYELCENYNKDFPMFSPKTRVGMSFFTLLYEPKTHHATKKTKMTLLRSIASLLNISALSMQRLLRAIRVNEERKVGGAIHVKMYKNQPCGDLRQVNISLLTCADRQQDPGHGEKVRVPS